MKNDLIYPAGSTAALREAARCLQELGLPIAHAPGPHVGHILLDIPSFTEQGQLRQGGDPIPMLRACASDAVVYGGGLDQTFLSGRHCVDLLCQEDFLAENARLTAYCALDVALPYLPVSLYRLPVLVLGWGRIGKCLARLLRNLDADVTVSARDSRDLAMLHALGYGCQELAHLPDTLHRYRLIFNTVPAPVLNREAMCRCRKDCVRIELASRDGMEGEDIVVARGLPTIHLPESSGRLIARTFLRYWKGVEL